MDIEILGRDIIRYGKRIKDNNIYTTKGWQRISVFKYEKELYWLIMVNGQIETLEKIF